MIGEPRGGASHSLGEWVLCEHRGDALLPRHRAPPGRCSKVMPPLTPAHLSCRFQLTYHPGLYPLYSLLSALCSLRFHSGVAPESVDELVQLLLGEVDLLGGTVHVEETGAHRDRHLVQVADLREDFLGDLPEADEAAFLGESAAVPQDELRLREALRELEHLVAVAPRKGSAIGDAGVVPGIVGEPEPSHILDTVEGDATGHAVSTTLVFDRRHVPLNGIVVEGHYTRESIRNLRSSEEFLDGTEERIRLLDVRHVTALVDDDQCSVEGTRALLG